MPASTVRLLAALGEVGTDYGLAVYAARGSGAATVPLDPLFPKRSPEH
jgi:hypothetical protein